MNNSTAVPASGTTVVITGASRGLGLALAERYVDAGAHVITITRSANPYLAQRAQAQGATLTAIEADLACPSGVQAAATELRAVLRQAPTLAGRHILINNAGAVEPVNLASDLHDPQAIAHAFALNVTAPLIITAAMLDSLLADQRDCRILNISSGAGRNPTAGWSVYCATKAALDMATRVLNAEQAEGGVRAVALAPGVVDTGMQATLRSQDTRNFPARERFVALRDEGKLRSADNVATSIHHYLNRDDFGTIEIDDIRKYD